MVPAHAFTIFLRTLVPLYLIHASFGSMNGQGFKTSKLTQTGKGKEKTKIP